MIFLDFRGNQNGREANFHPKIEWGELTLEDATGKQIILPELVEKQHFCYPLQ